MYFNLRCYSHFSNAVNLAVATQNCVSSYTSRETARRTCTSSRRTVSIRGMLHYSWSPKRKRKLKWYYTGKNKIVHPFHIVTSKKCPLTLIHSTWTFSHLHSPIKLLWSMLTCLPLSPQNMFRSTLNHF